MAEAEGTVLVPGLGAERAGEGLLGQGPRWAVVLVMPPRTRHAASDGAPYVGESSRIS